MWHQYRYHQHIHTLNHAWFFISQPEHTHWHVISNNHYPGCQYAQILQTRISCWSCSGEYCWPLGLTWRAAQFRSPFPGVDYHSVLSHTPCYNSPLVTNCVLGEAPLLHPSSRNYETFIYRINSRGSSLMKHGQNWGQKRLWKTTGFRYSRSYEMPEISNFLWALHLLERELSFCKHILSNHELRSVVLPLRFL